MNSAKIKEMFPKAKDFFIKAGASPHGEHSEMWDYISVNDIESLLNECAEIAAAQIDECKKIAQDQKKVLDIYVNITIPVMTKEAEQKDWAIKVLVDKTTNLNALNLKLAAKLHKSEKLLQDTDELLAYFEDFTHGEDGKKITAVRAKYNDLMNQNNKI